MCQTLGIPFSGSKFAFLLAASKFPQISHRKCKVFSTQLPKSPQIFPDFPSLHISQCCRPLTRKPLWHLVTICTRNAAKRGGGVFSISVLTQNGRMDFSNCSSGQGVEPKNHRNDVTWFYRDFTGVNNGKIGEHREHRRKQVDLEHRFGGAVRHVSLAWGLWGSEFYDFFLEKNKIQS